MKKLAAVLILLVLASAPAVAQVPPTVTDIRQHNFRIYRTQEPMHNGKVVRTAETITVDLWVMCDRAGTLPEPFVYEVKYFLDTARPDLHNWRTVDSDEYVRCQWSDFFRSYASYLGSPVNRVTWQQRTHGPHGKPPVGSDTGFNAMQVTHGASRSDDSGVSSLVWWCGEMECAGP